jgi:hypothetical protein
LTSDRLVERLRAAAGHEEAGEARSMAREKLIFWNSTWNFSAIFLASSPTALRQRDHSSCFTRGWPAGPPDSPDVSRWPETLVP